MDAGSDATNNVLMNQPVHERDRTASFVDRVVVKLMYKPVAMFANVVGTMMASMVFSRIWRALAGRPDVPGATEQAQGWADILPAAALHGIVFGVVKALVDRAATKEFEQVTGYWPGQPAPADDAGAPDQRTT
jgi:hypothetical protein